VVRTSPLAVSIQKTFNAKTQRGQAASKQRATRFNAEVAEVFAKGQRGNVFSADLRANHFVLGVKEIVAERDEVGRWHCEERRYPNRGSCKPDLRS
jgi:hypothetical protein